MTQEDKAKAYDEAIEKLREFYRDYDTISCLIDVKKELADIFPELKVKESEDERVLKAITKGMHDMAYDYGWSDFGDFPIGDILAWLEKQVEPTEINPSEFDSQLNRLLKQFQSLPKEELASSLNFYLNVVHNDGTYKEEKQREKPQGKSALEAINEVDNRYGVNDTPYDYERATITKKDFAPKQEPKFKVGDWISGYYTNYKVMAINSKGYVVEDTDGNKINILFTNEEFHHLFTIADAKDGDVLSNGKIIVIFKHFEDPLYRQYVVAYIGLDNSGDIQITDDIWNLGIDKAKPATKEQRDTLMKAMADAGYTFDFEKKELKKITDNAYCSENCKYDNMLGSCEIEHIEHGKYYYCIKDYYAGGNKRASKGDVVLAKRGMSMMALGVKANEYFLPVYQMPNQEWSEEDDDALGQAIIAVEDVMYDAPNNCYAMYKLPFSKVIERLKSIRGKGQ